MLQHLREIFLDAVKPAALMTATLLSGATAIGVMSPTAAQALTATLTVGGNNYDVTTLETSYSSSSAILQSQPWWQNNTLAAALADALATQLGTPNTGNAPYFAFEVSGTPPLELINYGYFNAFLGVDTSFDPVGNLLTFAVLDQPAPVNPAPGPLPLFGAAAAFGMSRRLRQRIRHAS